MATVTGVSETDGRPHTDRDWLRLNRANWDDRTRVHAASDRYDLPGFRAGGDSPRAFELAGLGDVHDLRLLHLQCHMGQDTLSWARRGAEVTGLDFSAEEILPRGLGRSTSCTSTRSPCSRAVRYWNAATTGTSASRRGIRAFR